MKLVNIYEVFANEVAMSWKSLIFTGDFFLGTL